MARKTNRKSPEPKKPKGMPEHIWKHNKIVELLDEHPDWYNLQVNQHKRAILMTLKPFIYELWKTRQLTKEEIRDAIATVGFKVSIDEIDRILFRLAWKFEEKLGAKPKRKPNGFRQDTYDAWIIEIGRKMPTYQMDPRIALRYFELIGASEKETSSNFFKACDIICSLESKAREAAGLEKSFEEVYQHHLSAGETVPADIRDDEEIKRWVKFN